MDEILALQAKLMQIQEEKPKILLSERNTMEILDYIKKDIDFQIVSTNDGKDFMTIEYLDKYIFETCQLHKKLRIVELENLINISSNWIESRVKILCQKYDLYFQNNQFLTKDYINKILQEIEDTLNQYKVCQLREVANKHDIDMQYLKSFFQNSNPINIEYQIDGRTNQIMSKRFFDSLDRKVKGYLIGKTSPITIQNLHEIFQIEKHILSNYFQNENFNIKNNLLYPQSFEKNKERKINDYLSRNHILNFKLFAKEFFITKPQEFLKKSQLRKDDLFLRNQSISSDYLQDILIQMEQVLREEGFCDFNDYCTENFTDENQIQVNNYLIERLQKNNIKVINHKNFFMTQKTFQDIKKKIEKNLLQKMPKTVFLENNQINDRLSQLENIQQYNKGTFLEFLTDYLKQNINFKKLKEKSNTQTKKQLNKGFDLNLVSIPNLITKTEQVCNYYLLMDKNFQIIIKKSQIKQQLEDILLKTKIITLQNIIFLILRKFQNIVRQEDQNDFEEEQFFEIQYLLNPLFKENKSLLSYFKVLPKEIKQVFFDFYGLESDTEKIDFLLSKDFNLTKFLNDNGSQITLGQFQINKQKKQEKKFIQDVLNQYEKYYEELDKIDKPYQGMIALCLIEYLESGYIMGFVSNYQDIKQIYQATKDSKNSKFSLIVQELQPRFEEFEEIINNNDETELEMFFEDLQEIDDEDEEDESDVEQFI